MFTSTRFNPAMATSRFEHAAEFGAGNLHQLRHCSQYLPL